MRILVKLMILFALVTSFTACSGVKKALRPMPWVFNFMPENAPVNYQAGWKDGCESGLASMTNDYYRTFYTYKMDTSLINDPMYYKTWKDVYTFCRHYSYGIIKEGDVRMRLPNAKPNDLSGETIFKVFESEGNTFGKGGFGKTW